MSNPETPRVVAATVDDVDAVTDQWVTLARDQRRHGSTLLASANRAAVRNWVARSVVTGELLVAREGNGSDERPDEEAIVGFVAFSIERDGYERDGTRGTVSNLFVSPERRNEGIGAALLAAAERELAAAGADAVALEALADNERARSFYADHGYDLHRVELRKEVGEESEGPDGSGGE
ncbi:Acetyltransferase (GNAT) family protein [Halorubrum aquaticum]|uniref:Acetyltransferase (GNAT) family protein n=1 Tax=Halorubrum aquaticum TaxID=387340 RepID=A0A1I2ZHX6_9EURY|nr:GNAT family N-acetyltransferase [Halorubrum aquaticum]SFH36721.1 Acetyltransferase (GNAT) family protein [Halorubrum aquaticum]